MIKYMYQLNIQCTTYTVNVQMIAYSKLSIAFVGIIARGFEFKLLYVHVLTVSVLINLMI